MALERKRKCREQRKNQKIHGWGAMTGAMRMHIPALAHTARLRVVIPWITGEPRTCDGKSSRSGFLFFVVRYSIDTRVSYVCSEKN